MKKILSDYKILLYCYLVSFILCILLIFLNYHTSFLEYSIEMLLLNIIFLGMSTLSTIHIYLDESGGGIFGLTILCLIFLNLVMSIGGFP